MNFYNSQLHISFGFRWSSILSLLLSAWTLYTDEFPSRAVGTRIYTAACSTDKPCAQAAKLLTLSAAYLNQIVIRRLSSKLSLSHSPYLSAILEIALRLSISPSRSLSSHTRHCLHLSRMYLSRYMYIKYKITARYWIILLFQFLYSPLITSSLFPCVRK